MSKEHPIQEKKSTGSVPVKAPGADASSKEVADAIDNNKKAAAAAAAQPPQADTPNTQAPKKEKGLGVGGMLKQFWQSSGPFGKAGLVVTGLVAVALLATLIVGLVNPAGLAFALPISAGLGVVRMGILFGETPERQVMQKQESDAKLKREVNQEVSSQVKHSGDLLMYDLLNNPKGNLTQVMDTRIQQHEEIRKSTAATQVGTPQSAVEKIHAESQKTSEKGRQ